MQLICAFVLAYTERRFSLDATQMTLKYFRTKAERCLVRQVKTEINLGIACAEINICCQFEVTVSLYVPIKD